MIFKQIKKATRTCHPVVKAENDTK